MKKLLHLFRGLGIILIALFLFLISPVAWPVYLGVFVLRPDLFTRLHRVQIF